MSIKIGINGFGRIGRMIFRACMERDDLEVVAINQPNMSPDHMAYLLKHDTVHGKFGGQITTTPNSITVNGRKTIVYGFKQAVDIPWREYGAQYILEASGKYRNMEAAGSHFSGGARKVLLTCPSNDAPTLVYGVNHTAYDPSMTIVAAGSCTTNCLAPIAKVLHEKFGIQEGLVTAVHAMTASQVITDGDSRKDWRMGRAAAANIIPTSSSSTKVVGKLIPELKGKLTGITLRVPVQDVSCLDLSVKLEKECDYHDICQVMKAAADYGPLKGVLGYTEEDVVSSDFIHESCVAVFDANAGVALKDGFVKIIAWFDNEWGFALNTLRTLTYMAQQDQK